MIGANHFIPQLDTLYNDWRRKYERGEKQTPFYFNICGADLPPRSMWDAVLASDGVAILQVKSLQKVSEYYNALDILLSKYSDMISFAEKEIIPYEDTVQFYYPLADKEKKLTRKYAAYMQRVQDMIHLFHAVHDRASETLDSING